MQSYITLVRLSDKAEKAYKDLCENWRNQPISWTCLEQPTHCRVGRNQSDGQSTEEAKGDSYHQVNRNAGIKIPDIYINELHLLKILEIVIITFLTSVHFFLILSLIVALWSIRWWNLLGTTLLHRFRHFHFMMSPWWKLADNRETFVKMLYGVINPMWGVVHQIVGGI